MYHFLFKQEVQKKIILKLIEVLPSVIGSLVTYGTSERNKNKNQPINLQIVYQHFLFSVYSIRSPELKSTANKSDTLP